MNTLTDPSSFHPRRSENSIEYLGLKQTTQGQFRIFDNSQYFSWFKSFRSSNQPAAVDSSLGGTGEVVFHLHRINPITDPRQPMNLEVEGLHVKKESQIISDRAFFDDDIDGDIKVNPDEPKALEPDEPTALEPDEPKALELEEVVIDYEELARSLQESKNRIDEQFNRMFLHRKRGRE